jgi:hypothetical protein
MSDEHDDEITLPGIPVPRHRAVEEHPEEPPDESTVAIIGIIAGLHRSVAALEKLAIACPPTGSPGRDRGVEILANAHGELESLHYDTRRALLALRREERAALADSRKR